MVPLKFRSRSNPVLGRGGGAGFRLNIHEQSHLFTPGNENFFESLYTLHVRQREKDRSRFLVVCTSPRLNMVRVFRHAPQSVPSL